ncbi:MAG: hypothetical protein DIZ77_11320 [endosymbiont of Seepiophila jonesi]|uniref:Uncharacterized protein n=1 Tax=endosymbiont of Lamellibrachia luymesi TaxID=2200907 RepID=A0A370E1L7_9GAMM|nr:MAG: hypothetical protein DIZ77_11320 [endosymbiont of Seepiophila jonesi]RDH93566.1 MAG: hypothetical protein DIZ79_00020 [endosymbiont of Lamellibrachia luymesi]
MKQTLFEETYPVFQLDIKRPECRFNSVDEIVAHIRQQIETHRSARFIAVFDHFAHTTALPEGQVAEEITAAVNIVFCFGLTLQDPMQLAVRPRSIGVCETEGHFNITFMEAPMPVANAAMEEWARSLISNRAAA